MPVNHLLKFVFDFRVRSFAKNSDIEVHCNVRLERICNDIDRFYQILQVAEWISIFGGKAKPKYE